VLAIAVSLLIVWFYFYLRRAIACEEDACEEEALLKQRWQ
jgi:hypothetical protein